LLHSLEVTGSAVALAGGCWKDVEVLAGDSQTHGGLMVMPCRLGWKPVERLS